MEFIRKLWDIFWWNRRTKDIRDYLQVDHPT